MHLLVRFVDLYNTVDNTCTFRLTLWEHKKERVYTWARFVFILFYMYWYSQETPCRHNYSRRVSIWLCLAAECENRCEALLIFFMFSLIAAAHGRESSSSFWCECMCVIYRSHCCFSWRIGIGKLAYYCCIGVYTTDKVFKVFVFVFFVILVVRVCCCLFYYFIVFIRFRFVGQYWRGCNQLFIGALYYTNFKLLTVFWNFKTGFRIPALIVEIRIRLD